VNPSHFTRREFLAAATSAGAMLAGTSCVTSPPPQPVEARLESRIRGLMLGTYLGDSLGGPIEFQPSEKVHAMAAAPKAWREPEVFDDAARRATINRLQLRSYRELRPVPEAYAHWSPHAAAGTITDDSRHKLVLLHALREAERRRTGPLDVRGLAQAYLDWPTLPALRTRPEYRELCADWLEEWQLGARWVLGERNLKRALPPERMWIGLPTCCGQMTLPPLAALYAGKPEAAYRAAYDLAYFDNGFGKDLNAALIAGLAVALVVENDSANPAAAWRTIERQMLATDPYRHGQVRWTHRAVNRWLEVSHAAVRTADRCPARLFGTLDREFEHTTKWEAQVPFTVVFAGVELAGYDPLAALQLSLEWGHDSDSYAQLLGAFVGALWGPEIFPAEWRTAVTHRLEVDYGVDFEKDVQLLVRLHQLNR
jgi:ADP-ribosylglycohydrolase